MFITRFSDYVEIVGEAKLAKGSFSALCSQSYRLMQTKTQGDILRRNQTLQCVSAANVISAIVIPNSFLYCIIPVPDTGVNHGVPSVSRV